MRFFLPLFLVIIFVIIASIGFYYLFFLVLLFANILNLVWGEFSEIEIKSSIMNFYTNSTILFFKKISALLLFLFIGWAIYFFDTRIEGLLYQIFFTITVGFLSGCFIITLAHDLLHSPNKIDVFLSNLLLLVSGAPHLSGHHILGHHERIGLQEDVSTAKKNQNVYAFIFQNIKDRLSNSFTNKMNLNKDTYTQLRSFNIMMVLIFVLISIIIYFVSQKGISTVIFFLMQGFIAYILYEIINYIQHYGLVRHSENEKISQFHSWNCYFKYTNYILFLLPIHSLHHLEEDDRKVPIEELKNAPKMPYVYFAMVGLSLIPKLWFNKMNHLADFYNEQKSKL